MSLQPALLKDEDSAPLARVTLRPGGGRAVIALSGELDLATAPLLSPVIHSLLAHGRNRITINLDDVTFLDVFALGTLVLAHRDVTRSQGSLSFTHNPVFERLLAMTGLITLLTAAG